VTDERLYLDAASGLRLFDDILHRCFAERLADHPEFANRMLPSRQTLRGRCIC
jgi:hypothetical protein